MFVKLFQWINRCGYVLGHDNSQPRLQSVDSPLFSLCSFVLLLCMRCWLCNLPTNLHASFPSDQPIWTTYHGNAAVNAYWPLFIYHCKDLRTFLGTDRPSLPGFLCSTLFHLWFWTINVMMENCTSCPPQIFIPTYVKTSRYSCKNWYVTELSSIACSFDWLCAKRHRIPLEHRSMLTPQIASMLQTQTGISTVFSRA